MCIHYNQIIRYLGEEDSYMSATAKTTKSKKYLRNMLTI